MACKSYVGDIGTEILVDCGEDVSSATAVSIIVKKPDASVSEWIGQVDPNEPNKFKYIVGVNDFDIAGKYLCQAKVTMGTWSGLGETFSFKVYAAFK